MNTILLNSIVSDDVLQCAYAWLCNQRKDYAPNSDIWHFRAKWPDGREAFIAEVLSGDYRYSPLTRYYIDGQTITVWAPQDALLLKAMTLVLEKFLAPVLPDCCVHVKGNGGVKGAVRQVSEEMLPGQFVMRTDVRQFYDSVDHYVLYPILCDLIPDKDVCRLILQSLQHMVVFRGIYQEVRKGLSRSNPMSPLLGAIALLPLDIAMRELPVFYCRYMDDWVIIADSRWKLRRAISRMHEVLAELHFTLHPDKTSIGCIEKGFDFLGYRLSLEELEPASTSADRVREKLSRLYEQGADSFRIGCFLLRWCAACRGGGNIFESVKLDGVVNELKKSFFYHALFTV